ncbi:hypothetical protein K474DRAFT_680748 [Panus rudis PR-1116 ss-1]|nr:hypothetical protein K474DRAFT_680748 [Panus rudis PR-1116 ss-1]
MAPHTDYYCPPPSCCQEAEQRCQTPQQSLPCHRGISMHKVHMNNTRSCFHGINIINTQKPCYLYVSVSIERNVGEDIQVRVVRLRRNCHL